MIDLKSPDLRLRVDPDHGGELTELLHLASGRQLLGHPPYTPAPARAGDLTETAWTAAYRGGWQLAAPNAGNSCRLGRRAHGFHGRASVSPWEVEALQPHSVRLRWRGHGLDLVRTMDVTANEIAVTVAWTAVCAPAPLITVEHIVFGRELLEPAVELHIDARAHELSERNGPIRPPADAPRWPKFRRHDGAIIETGPLALTHPRSGFAALTGLAQGRAEIVNIDIGLRVALAWDADQLPYAWLWQEVRASGGIWMRGGELLGIEPASVPHSLGLAEAVRHRQAHWARPGQRNGYRLTMTISST